MKNEDLVLSPQDVERVDKALAVLHEVFDEQLKRLPNHPEPKPGENERLYVLGLGSTQVRGHSSVNIHVEPMCSFQPERLLIPSDVARHFLLSDIKVGKNSQFVSAGGVPAMAFTEGMFGVCMKMDVAQIRMFVTVSVTNMDTDPHDFQGVIFGPLFNQQTQDTLKL